MARGLPADRRIKVVRHQDSNRDLYKLMVEGHIETYQRFQARPIFDSCDYIVSFLGLPRNQSRLIGVYKVGERERPEDNITEGYPYREEHENSIWFYQMEKLRGFEDYEERLTISWGKSIRSWHQWFGPENRDKEVTHILPKGFAREWPGYLDFILPYRELARILENRDANVEWHTRLSSVGGIYLLSHGANLYVGSAGGGRGILSRWQSYITTQGHGGNVRLKELIDSDPNSKYGLQFSILRTLPLATPNKEVIEIENLYKLKLSTRAHGLNAN